MTVHRLEVGREHGTVDVLVNNAAIIRNEMMGRTKFWEEPLNVIDHTRCRITQQLRCHSVRSTADVAAVQEICTAFTRTTGSHTSCGDAYRDLA